MDKSIKTIICKICSGEFKNNVGLISHITQTHKLSSKEYYDKYLKKENEGMCLLCGGDCNFLGIKKGYSKCCSIKCTNNLPERKKNNLERLKKMWNNDEYKSKMSRLMKELNSDKEFKKKMTTKGTEFRKRQSNYLKNKWKDKEYKREMSKVSTKRNIKYRDEISNRMKNGQAAYMNSFIKNPSKPQVELFNIVKGIYPNAKLNYQILNYSVDIVIKEIKLAIEYDGSYWHKDKEKDNLRQNKIMNEGWNFLRYRDRVPDKDELVRDIKENIYG